MPKLNQRGIAHLLVPLLLLGGIIVTVYLITAGPLKLFSRAASAPTSWPPISDRIEIVDDKGNPITTTNTTKVKLKVTWVSPPPELVILSQGTVINNPNTSTISANPNPASNGNTTITWNTGDGSVGQVRVQVDDSMNTDGTTDETIFAEGVSGSQEANWIQSGHAYHFYLYNKEDPYSTRYAQVAVTRPTQQVFPEGFRVANSEKELFSAPEYAFTDNPTTIDWVLDSGAGTKTVYTQFKLGDSWGGTVHASIELTESETQECTINQFAETFGSSTDDYRYIKNCDVNYDGKINIYDIFDLLRNRPHI